MLEAMTMKTVEKGPNDTNIRNFAKMFNMNNVLTHVIAWGAYFVVILSILVLAYLSFVEKFDISLDWRTVGVFSIASTLLGWTCWNTFYHKQYERLMSEDIQQQKLGKYSIHARYYNAIKDWNDMELQKAIDAFNDEYTKKWLNWVEKVTGKTIEEIKNGSYKGFKYKRLMYKIKKHKYPQSGYKTSMELMSLLSYQDANLNKRKLHADRSFYIRHTVQKLLTSVLFMVTAAALIPEMISGQYWSAVLKLIVALCSLSLSVFMGAMNGVKGARMKLSIVEDACVDLEHWAEKKPIIEPYSESIIEESKKIEETPKQEESSVMNSINSDIFSKLNIPKS